MRKKIRQGSYDNVCGHKMSYKDIFDQSLYDETIYEEDPDLQYSAISEGADAKDIYRHISRELPPRCLGKREELTEAQKLSKLGASSTKAR
ncbi:MAG: hypothetical protein MSA09_13640 [Lachnospiraceae bacterium]|nr:hypothetical protein [Lachnospiraceae bacterium]MDD7178216.1 hypothetical protein [bacterium]MDY5518652.1 hypothetical protein [Lachnospiraceae bacterium]